MANENQQTLRQKLVDIYLALVGADLILTSALLDNTSNRNRIHQQRGHNHIQEVLLLAKIEAIDGGKVLSFPSSSEIQALETAVQALKAAVKSSADYNTVIEAAADVAKEVSASKL